MIKTRIRHKRDTLSNWTNKNPLLLNGEIVIVEDGDSILLKRGDGTKNFNQLPFIGSDIDVSILATKTELEDAEGSITTYIDSHINNKSNPHGITKATLNLGNVDNTADINKTVKAAGSATKATQDASGNVITATYATKTEVNDAVQAVSSELSTHVSASNPHGITKSLLGLGNVDNTADSAKKVAEATKATKDGSGNTITTTYATKTELSDATGAANTYTDSAINALKYAGSSSVGGAATSAAKLSTARTIDGISFDGSAAITHYGTCSTAAGTAAKTVTITGFKLVTGASVKIKFDNTNTASSPTLNVNSTGAKSILYRGNAPVSLTNYHIYEFVYDGTYWRLVSGEITMTAATADAAGKGGLVPAPAAGKQASYLRGDGTWAVPTNTTYSAATTSAAGLMSAADKTKLDGIASGANKYTHPSYTAKSSGLYKVTVDSTGHVSAATAVAKSDITALGIPAQDTVYTLPTASSTLGGVKTTSTVTSTSGLTACPIISGVPYYKDTNNTYNLSSFSITATAAELNVLDGITATTAELNYCDGVTSNIQTQLNGKLSTSGTAAKATADASGNTITSTYETKANAITGLSVSGKTITYTKGNGTTGTITTQDTNTTYSTMGAATSSAAGTSGLVPAPAAGKQASFLRGDGTWVVPTNTTYTAMTASEATTGTATTARSITAKVLHNKIAEMISASTASIPLKSYT